MSKVEIYYFSGTGNSLAVARDIARRLNGKLIPVMSVMDQDLIGKEADVIGMVFPIYDFKPPKLLADFIGKLADIGSKYLFAVSTYGVTPLKAMKKADADVAAQGGKLSAGFNVQMPHNGIGYGDISVDKQKEMFRNWDIKLDVVADYVDARKEGCLETTNVMTGFILSGMLFKALPSIASLLWHVMRHGWASMGFIADEKCSGCGTCVRVCPMQNISMAEQRPCWSDHCVSCFACIQWCPREAIRLGNYRANLFRYRHPEVKLSDMLRENRLGSTK